MSLMCLYLLVASMVAGNLGKIPVMEPDDNPEVGSGEAALVGAGLPELGASWVGGPVRSQLGPFEEALGSGDSGSGEGLGSGSSQ